MIRIHREGKLILRNSFLLLLCLNIFMIQIMGLQKMTMFFIPCISILLYAWIIYFFRDPIRKINQHHAGILSPADGKIVVIQQIEENEYFHDTRLQVSIFMSPFNVHVNRSPISGILKYFKYHVGKYLVAFHEKSSTKNERTTAVIQRNDGTEILFRQIAGFVARRIEFYPQIGDKIQQGDEVGFIKFGSRLDLFLPLNTKLLVQVGDHVKGGLSLIA
jgi:phosphatidylserine decarboxylase